MTEAAILGDVSLDVPWALVEAFAGTPRWKPADVNASAAMIVGALEGAGVPVTVHDAHMHLSIPFDARVKSGGRTFRAKPPAYSLDCRQGRTAPIVHVPATYSRTIGTLFDKNQDASLSSADRVRGKIVISEGFAFPHKILEFEQKGAVGVIAVNPGIDIHWGICTSIWGTPDLDDLPRKPGIPVVAVNNPDGKALIAIAEAGGEVTLETEMEEGWYDQKLPVVEIRGAVEPEKFVLLHGHYDSWDVGVGDNATGDATMVELARVLWKHRGSLRRSVRIAWWPGHSTGRYAGSTWFADKYAIDLDENCVAQINCDSPGCRWATTFKDLSLMPETEAFVAKVVDGVCGLPIHAERPHRAGDYSFNNIGISSFLMLSSTMPDDVRAEKGYYAVGGCGGNIAWHTENDTIEIADRDILLRDMKVYLAGVLGVANAEVLPFDWRAVTAEFRTTLGKYADAAGAGGEFGAANAALSELDTALAAFYSMTERKALPAAAANHVIMGLARILVPINFSREVRFRHDPALPVPPLPMLAVASEMSAMPEYGRGFARVQLQRGLNRFIAAMRAATALVQSAAARA